MGVLQSGLLLGIQAVYVCLNQLVLPNVDLLGLFYDFSDVLPLEFLLRVLENMGVFKQQKNVSPFNDMRFSTADLYQLQNS